MQEDRLYAQEAVALASLAEKEYEAELCKRFLGEHIQVSVVTEGVERMIQDGHELYPQADHLEEVHLVVIAVFLTEESHSKEKSPLIYASRVGKYDELLRGSGVSFRLLRATKLEIIAS